MSEQNKKSLERGSKKYPFINIHRKHHFRTSFIWWGWKTAQPYEKN